MEEQIMKTVTTMLCIVVLSATVFAQEKTLLSGDIEHGGYGAFFTKVGQLNGGTGIFMGGQGAWLINHRLGIGGKGYGLVNELAVEDLQNIKLEFGCWGGLLEYHMFTDKMVDLNIQTMIGAGGVRYSVIDYQDPHDEVDWSDDGFFVVEPGIGLDLHIAKSFRLGAEVTYRVVNGVDYADLANSDLNGLSAELILKFGRF
jgi:hypothetical protein